LTTLRTMRLTILCFLVSLNTIGQPASLNTTLVGHLPYAPILNDIWGWVDDQGREYALVGAINGFSVADVTNPEQPQELIFIQGPTSVWRDIKTFGPYAYVSHDVVDAQSAMPASGLLIVDLRTVRDSSPVYRWYHPEVQLPLDTSELRRAHNVYIDEFARLYVFGSNVGNGGALIFDLSQDVWEPPLLGFQDQFYYHDGYARGDTLWVAAVFNGFIAAIDVGLPWAPRWLGQVNTPGSFAHNVWPSDDGKFVFSTDEIARGLVGAFEVRNINNMRYISATRASIDPVSVPHNVHVKGRYLFTSHYTSGLHIADAGRPDNLIEIGYYDTSPLTGSGFKGAWGAYPFLPSGNILVSDMEAGLFIIRFEEKEAAWLYGNVIDSLTGFPIPNASIRWLVRGDEQWANIGGAFKGGHHSPLLDTLAVWAQGYQGSFFPIQLTPGEASEVRITLLPEGYRPPKALQSIQALPGLVNPAQEGRIQFSLDGYTLPKSIRLMARSVHGDLVFDQSYSGPFNNQIDIQTGLPSGMYYLEVRLDETSTKPEKLLVIW
jgi:choice-of-anchor B domain-containing protein